MSDKPTGHALLSPSAAERWFNCPGSVEFTKQFPNEQSRYSAEGSLAHSFCSKLLERKLSEDQFFEMIGTSHVQDGFDIELTDEMFECVMGFVGLVESTYVRSAELYVEERVNAPQIHPELWGTSDARVVIPFEKSYVFDFKYGKGKKVSAFKNKQMLIYALGGFFTPDVGKEIELVIYQPRVSEEPDRYTLTYEEYKAFVPEVKEAARLATEKDAPLIAGNWCSNTFCPAFGACPAAEKKARSLAVNDFSVDPKQAARKLTTVQLKKVLDSTNFINSFLNAASNYAKELLVQGETIPGWGLAMGVGNRKWVDEAAVVANFHPQFGDEIYESLKVKSPAQFEKLIPKKKREEALNDYVVRSDTGYKLVPEDKAQKNITQSTAKNDFA